MSSIMRWRSGVVVFVMVGSIQKVAGATILTTWLLTVGQRPTRPRHLTRRETNVVRRERNGSVRPFPTDSVSIGRAMLNANQHAGRALINCLGLTHLLFAASMILPNGAALILWLRLERPISACLV